MRAVVHPFIETTGLSAENKADIKMLREATREVILSQLLEFQKKRALD